MNGPDLDLPCGIKGNGTDGTWTAADYDTYEVRHITTPEYIEEARLHEPEVRRHIAELKQQSPRPTPAA
jgi:hypothetical protein